MLPRFWRELSATQQKLAEAAAALARTEAGAAPAPRGALEILQRDLDATRAECDGLRAAVDAAGAADADGGAALRAARDEAAAAKARCKAVEEAAATLRTGADLVRRKFEALEKEIGDARSANAALRARLDGGAAPPPMETEDRFAYLRNLMMEFLADPEPDARAHLSLIHI